jgi:hypothetical protein
MVGMTQATRIRQEHVDTEAEADQQKQKTTILLSVEDAAVVRLLREQNPTWRTEALPPSVIQKAVDDLSGSDKKCGATKAYRIQGLVQTAPEDLPEGAVEPSGAGHDRQKPESAAGQNPKADGHHASPGSQSPQNPEASTAPALPEPAPTTPPLRKTVRAPQQKPPALQNPEPAPRVLAETLQPQKPVRTWPVLLLTLPAFVAIWSGWVGLGELTGFGVVHPLPGIAPDFSLNTAITLPIGVETYAAFALRVWLSGKVAGRARTFAKWSAIGSLLLGAAGQVAYHLMTVPAHGGAPWLITTIVACLPVAVLGMGAALADLVNAKKET